MPCLYFWAQPLQQWLFLITVAVVHRAVTHLSKKRTTQPMILVMKKWLTTNKCYLIGAAIGSVGGFCYWKFIGCTSGSCAITSSPINSSLYGAMMGALVSGMFKKEEKKTAS